TGGAGSRSTGFRACNDAARPARVKTCRSAFARRQERGGGRTVRGANRFAPRKPQATLFASLQVDALSASCILSVSKKSFGRVRLLPSRMRSAAAASPSRTPVEALLTRRQE